MRVESRRSPRLQLSTLPVAVHRRGLALVPFGRGVMRRVLHGSDSHPIKAPAGASITASGAAYFMAGIR